MEIEVQEDRRALGGRHAKQGPAEVGASDRRIFGSRDRLGAVETQYRPPRGAPRRARLVDDDAEEPGPKVASGSDVGQASPRLESSLLHGVLSRRPIEQHAVGEPRPGPDHRRQKFLEGGLVAAARTRDQLWVACLAHASDTLQYAVAGGKGGNFKRRRLPCALYRVSTGRSESGRPRFLWRRDFR